MSRWDRQTDGWLINCLRNKQMTRGGKWSNVLLGGIQSTGEGKIKMRKSNKKLKDLDQNPHATNTSK